ncbi:MAG TPA: MarR family transcriptional regulator [Ensifer sp.]|nr:MarR family transcriptional regulator [Ensifer sp.]
MSAQTEHAPGRTKPKTDADITLIAQVMSRMRLMIGRRIIGRMAIKRAAPTLELSHLDVIEAVRRLSEHGEVTVGAVADMMHVDPSRSSRLISELVQGEFLVRCVSQADARRAVVELTDKARAYFREAQSIKRALIESIVADWTPEEIADFGRLYLKFVDEFEARAKASSD